MPTTTREFQKVQIPTVNIVKHVSSTKKLTAIFFVEEYRALVTKYPSALEDFKLVFKHLPRASTNETSESESTH